VLFIQVPYRLMYEQYSIAVIPAGNKFNVQFMLKYPDRSISVEVCESEQHAVKGAEYGHIFESVDKAAASVFDDIVVPFRRAATTSIGLVYAYYSERSGIRAA
jgi:homogentisate 1,2-dioxygenase